MARGLLSRSTTSTRGCKCAGRLPGGQSAALDLDAVTARQKRRQRREEIRPRRARTSSATSRTFGSSGMQRRGGRPWAARAAACRSVPRADPAPSIATDRWSAARRPAAARAPSRRRVPRRARRRSSAAARCCRSATCFGEQRAVEAETVFVVGEAAGRSSSAQRKSGSRVMRARTRRLRSCTDETPSMRAA